MRSLGLVSCALIRTLYVSSMPYSTTFTVSHLEIRGIEFLPYLKNFFLHASPPDSPLTCWEAVPATKHFVVALSGRSKLRGVLVNIFPCCLPVFTTHPKDEIICHTRHICLSSYWILFCGRFSGPYSRSQYPPPSIMLWLQGMGILLSTQSSFPKMPFLSSKHSSFTQLVPRTQNRHLSRFSLNIWKLFFQVFVFQVSLSSSSGP